MVQPHPSEFLLQLQPVCLSAHTLRLVRRSRSRSLDIRAFRLEGEAEGCVGHVCE